MSTTTHASSGGGGLLGEARALMKARPFELVLGTWGSVLVATGAFLWRRQIPFQLKVIQARILAQASLVTGAMVFGAMSLSAEAPADAAEAAAPPGTSHKQWVLRNFAEVGEAERKRPAMGKFSRAAELEAAAAARAAAAEAAEAAVEVPDEPLAAAAVAAAAAPRGLLGEHATEAVAAALAREQLR